MLSSELHTHQGSEGGMKKGIVNNKCSQELWFGMGTNTTEQTYGAAQQDTMFCIGNAEEGMHMCTTSQQKKNVLSPAVMPGR